MYFDFAQHKQSLRSFQDLKQKGFGAIQILIAVVIVAVLVGGAFYLGQQNSNPQSQSSVVISTTPQPSPSGDSSSQDYFVSFAKVNNKILLRYKDKIYDDSNPTYMEPITLPNMDSYTWYELVQAPSNVNHTSHDDIFSFKVFPNSDNFMFVMRWTRPISPEQFKWDFKVFYYDSSKVDNKVLSQFMSVWPEEKGYPVPKIDQISSDEQFVSFNMYGCWNCGGHQPQKLLLKINEPSTDNIGKVSYFKWLTKGQFEYKDYKVIECSEPTPGECSEDPSNLPLKTGQFTYGRGLQ